MRDIQEFFKLGMARDIPPLLGSPSRVEAGARILLPSLELGGGNESKHIPTTYKMGRPRWNAEVDPHIPLEDASIGEIHAYHFFEHLTGDTAMRVLMECQRLLAPGGVLNIVVPYYNSNLQHQSLDHRSTWNEGTWQVLFSDAYFDDLKVGWELVVHCCFIMGIVERNLALFTQLAKR